MAVSRVGVWSALYVGALAFTGAQLTGIGARPTWGAIWACILIGLGVYLLDRVGVRRVDPADGTPWPTDARKRAFLRGTAVTALIAATIFAWRETPWFAIAPAIGLATVTAYAGVAGLRLKDRVWLKGPVVAVCLTLLGMFASQSHRVMITSPSVAFVGIAMFLFVLGDCVLSDLDDFHQDRAAGVGSLVAAHGPRAASVAALAIHVAAGAMALIWSPASLPAAIWAGSLVLTTGLLVASKPVSVRTIVDLRVPTIAVVVWLTWV